MTNSNYETVIESLDTDLGSSSGDNISFHQANKAYYEDRDYNEAIKKFQAAIEYEILQSPDSLDTEIIVKSIYWLGESYLKLNQIDRAFEEFRQLSEHCSQHHLGRSAQRQASSLLQQDVILKEKHKPKEREQEAKQRTEAKTEHQKREHQLQIVRKVIAQREKEVKQRTERKRQEAAERREKERQEKARRAREAKQRTERKRQERAQRKRKKQTLLKSLREHLERDFLTAYDFYQTQCTAHISPEEYEIEKHNVERRERERQEKIRREREVKQRAERERREAAQQREKERQKRIQHEKEKQTLLKNLREHLQRHFLTAYDFFQDRCTEHISADEYETEKVNYVQSWAEGLGLEYPPDPEQAAAIGAVEGNVQVIARAGSGKTATLVNRALFLQEHCDVESDEMLLLAFNRKAAEEMRERLTSNLQDSTPHVMTFHALAYALVHPEKILFDEPEGEQSQSGALQDIIDQHLHNSNYYNQIRALMTKYFRDDWERIISGGHNRTPSEMLRYRRLLAQESLDGTYVKSFPEKDIANFLFEHDIEYKYERNFWWDGINYRPDFTIGDRGGVIIEYFGLEGTPDYDARSEEKRDYWRNKPGWELLEFSPNDLASSGVNSFYLLLRKALQDRGITCNRLSEEEIWKRIKDRAIDRFTTVVKGFIQRCRKLSLTPEQLSERVNNHDYANDVEERFLNLVQVFYESYLEHLQATGEEDFDGLMQKAVEMVTAGNTEFRYRSRNRSRIGNLAQIQYVLIDEYQDFSELFYRLMKAVREHNSRAHFFCVGDDWQAINSFAGSDLRFFENFSQDFQGSRKLYVTTNYRSASAIVNVGNELMRGLGRHAHAHTDDTGKVMIADLATFEPTPQEKRENPGDDLTPAVLRLVNKAINEGKNVVLLSRKNSLPWYVNYRDQRNPSVESGLDRFLRLLRARLPDELAEKFTISTTHNYKGLQKDVVIVLDAVPRCYPLIHPNLIFTHVLGDSVESVVAEERRLFYVALTRAVEELFILTEKDNFSPFLEDLEKNIKLSRLSWSDYPPLEGKIQYITIRVGNQNGRGSEPTKKIKELLKPKGYRWNGETWYSIRPAEGFSVRAFADQEIWGLADGITVGFYDHLDNMIELYHIDDGLWKCISNNIRESDD